MLQAIRQQISLQEPLQTFITHNAQIVASIIAAKPVADRRASIVFADGPMYNG